MRYITVPAPVKLPGMKRADGSPMELDFFEYHEQNVWSNPAWRSSADMHKVFRELVDIFDEAQKLEEEAAGEVLEIPGRHYEIYLPLATGKDQQLAPRVARALSPFHEAVFDAPNKDPRKKQLKRKGEPSDGEGEESPPSEPAPKKEAQPAAETN
jgi:hypothetical protein